MIPLSILQELNNIFNRAKSGLKSDRNIDLKFILSNCPFPNAFATPNNEIHITKQLFEKLFCCIVTGNMFNKPVEKILEKCNINDDFMHVKKCIYIITMSICYFHELGHVVNGHLKYLNRATPCLDVLSELLNITDFSSTITSYTDRSLFEHDADTYAGIATAGLVFNNFGIKCSEDKKFFLEKYIVLLSSFILFFNLLQIAQGRESSNYPPILWRFLSMSASFLESYLSLKGDRGLPNDPVKIILNESFINGHYDNDTKELFLDIYSAAGFTFPNIEDVFKSPNMTVWYKFYRENQQKILDCHKFAVT